jgi:hypothetical protein
VALPFKVASSSQIKQGGIILRNLSPHLWTSGSNRTPQEGCGPQDRTVHHTVQGCPHQMLSNRLNMSVRWGSHPSTISLVNDVSTHGHRKTTCSPNKHNGMLEICCALWPMFRWWCVGNPTVLWFIEPR